MPLLDSCNVASGSPAGTRRSISLILPAWNEAGALPRALAEADAALRSVADDYEILVVDDGSTDATAQVVAEAAQRMPAVRLIQHPTNLGYGAALRSGFAAARCELVGFTDADNQFDLSELDRLVLLAERHEVVCGYRIDRKDSPLRCFYSRCYNVLVRGLLGVGVRDVDCALKLFHRDALGQLPITTNGFLVNSELLTQARRLGFSIVEVGVSHRPRVEGDSTVSARHIPKVLGELGRFWWNRVAFPGDAAPDRPTESRRALINGLSAALLVVTAILFFTNLSYPLLDRDETRYAEIPREMVVTGNWVLPQLNFKPYYDKPPLMYWLCSASYELFGVNEYAARLPQVLAAFGTLALTLLFARRWLGPGPGLAAALVLLVSVGFFGSSRILLIDGLLTALVTLTAACAFEAVRGPSFRYGWWLAAAMTCGAGFLTKGPIAFVLVAPPIAAYSFLSRGASQPRLRDWAVMLGVVAAMATPWLIAVSRVQPSFAYEFFYLHNVARFAGAFHAQPIWYFVPILLVAGHPWSYLTIPCVRYFGSQSAADRESRSPVLGFFALWAGWCVLFFSMSSCKLPSYVMPALPPLAMLMGYYVYNRLVLLKGGKASLLERVAPWNAALASGLGGFGFATFVGVAGVERAGVAIAFAVAWLALTVATQLLRTRIENPIAAWGVSLAMVVPMGVLVMHRQLPRFAEFRTLLGPGSALTAQLAADSTAPIATFSHEWAEAPYYLHREDIQNLSFHDTDDLSSIAGSDGRLYVVMRKKDNRQDLLDDLPTEASVRVVGERGSGVVLEVDTDGTSLANRPADLATHR
ncbi:Undecaprenyl phosphate-alpha-4-amino-4-deoxy-L-arabinose arabinosyl transferase [Botrimarina colliarenosi]|uniref:Undecaprenyl phosphate-alpha-4-amino-4-deoxy-L-arabinose arabinosyl transferase n=1 Tax=Botrimarina colliarenosi TaxID=2528001 RepID=A0A5C6AGH1_9BACT|nr:glycosyltransferase [Botrimarina colliarenosi]TWT98161.1 Undecaprenyl phosphate-alpha-4-amino-4-deoxy-L-arabinose arabinosyl transferase [Botrimarina colliarenosi]